MTGILVFVLATFAIANCAVVPSTPEKLAFKGFKHIGEFQENDYYVNYNSRIWVEAKEECKNVFDGGVLISIETPAEHEFIKNYLERFGAAHNFLTSGTYSGSQWFWDATNEPVSQNILSIVQGSDHSNVQDTIRIEHINKFNSKLSLISKSEPVPYICEVPRNCQP